MLKEKIAVLLSAFNGAEYLRTQIDSILEQKTDCEVLLVIRDDGSTDKTVEIIEQEYARPNVRLIKGNNVGFVESFMNLLRYAEAELGDYNYFSLADQDDRWDSNKLQVAVEAIRKDGRKSPLLYACLSRLTDDDLIPLKTIDRSGRIINFYNSIIQNFLPGHTYVMNRSLLSVVYNCNPHEIYAHDQLILNVAVLYHGLLYDETPHADYRQHKRNQLGASNRFYGWFLKGINRIGRGDNLIYTRQIQYIYKHFKNLLTEEESNEMHRFFLSRKSFLSRIKYTLNTKLYRQKKKETMIFKVFYVFGGYND